MKKGALVHLAAPGRDLAVRVRPGAKADSVTETTDGLEVRVTAPPSNGAANAALLRLLAKALDLPRSRIEIRRGAAARDKVVRLHPAPGRP